MKAFLEKMRSDSFLVLAGDIYQIESIDFGNWFSYAKDVVKAKGSNIELLSNWRTDDRSLRELAKTVFHFLKHCFFIFLLPWATRI